METSTVIHSTFVLERTLKATPEKVFAAFADTATKRRWFFESSHHELQHHELDFKVGGKEQARMKFAAGPIAGKVITNDSVYEDIQPNRRIVTAYRMSMDGKPFSVSLATIELQPQGTGTTLVLTHQGAYLEGADGPEMRKGGWDSLLSKLVKELGE
jgi:uncharacterized protein YndB with AHSA1/START domain